MLYKVDRQKLNTIRNAFYYDRNDIQRFYDAFCDERKERRNTNMFLDTHVTFEATHIKCCNGDLLAIDVGGTYLKILLFNNSMEKKFPVAKYPISRSESQKNQDLFDWIAVQVSDYLCEYTYPLEKLKAGMTFSYPVKMESISKGKVLGFTKDFPFKEYDPTIQIDPIQYMNEAFQRHGMNIVVEVLLNDTTATFLASYMLNKNTTLGIVLGTGTNGAFISNNALINSEWGQFDSNLIKKNEYDQKIKENLKGKSFANIDCMLGGLKLEEMLNNLFHCNDSSAIINEYYKHAGNTFTYNCSCHVVRSIKERIYIILAIFTIALNDDKKLYISVNGSGLDSNIDKDLFKDCIVRVANIVGKSKCKEMEFIHVHDASLVGCAYALLYHGKIPDNLVRD